jgi:hypothetical protein
MMQITMCKGQTGKGHQSIGDQPVMLIRNMLALMSSMQFSLTKEIVEKIDKSLSLSTVIIRRQVTGPADLAAGQGLAIAGPTHSGWQTQQQEWHTATKPSAVTVTATES